jgi:hypothetical protein
MSVDETSEQPVYEVVCFEDGGEYGQQYGELFIDKDQAEQVAHLLNEQDEYNYSHEITRGNSMVWGVKEAEIASTNSYYFSAYSATIDNMAKYKQDFKGQYQATKPKAGLVKSFLPFDEAVQFDGGVRKDRWSITLWGRTPDELQTRVDEVLTRLNESNDPGELHII